MVIEVVASVLHDIVGYENSSKEWYWASCFVGKLSIHARLFYPSLQLPKGVGHSCLVVELGCLAFELVLFWSALCLGCLVLFLFLC